MKKFSFYWFYVCFSIFLVFTLNIVFNFAISTFLWVLACFGIMIAPYALMVLLIKYMPPKWFNAEKKIFHVFKFEAKLYEFFGIKKWKDKIPELGKSLAGFDKSQIASPKDNNYLMMYLTESCKGSFGHVFCFVWGFLSLIIVAFVCPYPFLLTAGLPIAFVSGSVHLLSIMVLRYMRPRLLKLYSINKKRQESEQKQQQADA